MVFAHKLVLMALNAFVLVNMKVVNANTVIKKDIFKKKQSLSNNNFKKILVKACISNPCLNGFSCLSTGNGSFICECKKDLKNSLYKLTFFLVLLPKLKVKLI